MNAETRMRHFHSLERDQQEEVILRLAAVGYADHAIADATLLAIEQVRRVLSHARASNEGGERGEAS